MNSLVNFLQSGSFGEQTWYYIIPYYSMSEKKYRHSSSDSSALSHNSRHFLPKNTNRGQQVKRRFDEEYLEELHPVKKRKQKKKQLPKTTTPSISSSFSTTEIIFPTTSDSNAIQTTSSTVTSSTATSTGVSSSTISTSSSTIQTLTSTPPTVSISTNPFRKYLMYFLQRSLNVNKKSFVKSMVMTPDLFRVIIGLRTKSKKIMRVFYLYQVRHIVKGRRYRFVENSLDKLFVDISPNWKKQQLKTKDGDKFSLEIFQVDFNFFEAIGLLEIKGQYEATLIPE